MVLTLNYKALWGLPEKDAIDMGGFKGGLRGAGAHPFSVKFGIIFKEFSVIR